MELMEVSLYGKVSCVEARAGYLAGKAAETVTLTFNLIPQPTFSGGCHLLLPISEVPNWPIGTAVVVTIEKQEEAPPHKEDDDEAKG